MKNVADVLYLLATFSVRSGFLEKATVYASAGRKLFPSDPRQHELYAYSLMLRKNYPEAQAAVQDTDLSTPNLEYLRSRIAILQDKPKGEIQTCLRRYLTAV